METLKTQSLGSTGSQQAQQPERLSKLGQWMQENKGGIITVLDRRAVNK